MTMDERADWVEHKTEYNRLDFVSPPLSWYVGKLMDRTPIALARWSDGEWPCVLGSQGRNTDKHPYSWELRRDLTATLDDLANGTAPRYIKGIQELVTRQHPLNESVHTWMLSRGLTVKWVSGETFHRASIKDTIGPFIDALHERGVILVGPARLAPMADYFPIERHIEIPLINCHSVAEDTIHRVVDALDAHPNAAVSYSASMSTKYQIPEILKRCPDATLIDVGALWEPYVGVNTRRYHGAVIVRLRGQGRLGGTPNAPRAEAPAIATNRLPPAHAMTPRIAVFTAAVGKTDPLRQPLVLPPDVDFFCATADAVPNQGVWRTIQVPLHQDDPVWTARRFKLLLHEYVQQFAPEADVYLWLDAAYELQVDPRVFLPAVLRNDLAVLRHPHRDTIRAEAHALQHRNTPPHPSKTLLDRQLDHYALAGYPDERLSSTGLLVRRNDRRTARFNARWWYELQAHGHTRDQMSFDYTAWKLDLAIGFLDGHYRDNPYAQWHHTR